MRKLDYLQTIASLSTYSRIERIEKYYAGTINLSWLSSDITVMKLSSLKGRFYSFDHSHNYRELCFVMSGSGLIIIDGAKTYPLKEGRLAYLDVGVPHHLASSLDDPMEVFIMPFMFTPKEQPTDKIPAQWAEDEGSLLQYVEKQKFIIAEDSGGCAKDLRDLIEFTELSNRGEFVKIKNYVSNFLISALQSLIGIRQPFDFMKILESLPSFNATDKYIREHYMEGITLPALAEALHYSPRQCQRIISECMGISFSELLLDLQLTHAKELLRYTNETLEEIAEHSGFKSGKALSNQFKEQEGITPSRYRESFKQSPASD